MAGRPSRARSPADQADGEVAVGESKHPLRLLLVDNSRVARADAQVGRCSIMCAVAWP